MSAPKLLLDTREQADYLGISERKLQELAKSNETFRRMCPLVELGAKTKRRRSSDLANYVASLEPAKVAAEPKQLRAARERRAGGRDSVLTAAS